VAIFSLLRRTQASQFYCAARERDKARPAAGSIGFAVEGFGGELLGRGGQRFLARPDGLGGHRLGGRLVAGFIVRL
jgi:hypothetical protein